VARNSIFSQLSQIKVFGNIRSLRKTSLNIKVARNSWTLGTSTLLGTYHNYVPAMKEHRPGLKTYHWKLDQFSTL